MQRIILLLIVIAVVSACTTIETPTVAVTNEDVCEPPAKMNAEEWQTHMSHHPDMYEGCL